MSSDVTEGGDYVFSDSENGAYLSGNGEASIVGATFTSSRQHSMEFSDSDTSTAHNETHSMSAPAVTAGKSLSHSNSSSDSTTGPTGTGVPTSHGTSKFEWITSGTFDLDASGTTASQRVHTSVDGAEYSLITSDDSTDSTKIDSSSTSDDDTSDSSETDGNSSHSTSSSTHFTSNHEDETTISHFGYQQ